MTRRLWLAAIRRSLLLRLLVVLAVAGGLAFAVVAWGLRKAVDRDDSSERLGGKNLRRYVQYIAQDVGLPPDEARLQALAHDTGLDLRVEWAGRAWTTAPGLASAEELAATAGRQRRGGRLGLPVGRHDGRFFVMADAGDARYVLFTPRGVDLDVREGVVAATLGALALVVLGSLLLVNRMLRPLHDLARGVRRLAAGQLGEAVPVRGDDELADLSRSFNAMSASLREMLAAKEQLLLDVSHELRSPMTRIKVALEMLDGPRDAPAKASIAEDLRELESLTTSLLDSARLGSPHGRLPVAAHDLAALCRDAARAAPGPVTLALPDGTVPALCDPDAARTALRNVLENAFKHGAATAGQQPRVTLTLARTPDGAPVVTVRDNGPGIPDAELERVFEPFYRMDKSRSKATGGFGLGLPLARRMMRAQGGDLTLARMPLPASGAVATLVFQAG